MNWYHAFIALGLIGAASGVPAIYRNCRKESGKFVMQTNVVIPSGESSEYVTFVKDDKELLSTCSSSVGQITGSGSALDPYNISIAIDPTVDPDVGSTDCGFVRVGESYTWIVRIVQAVVAVSGTNRISVSQTINCDFAAVTENPSAVIVVNETANASFLRVELMHVSKTVELSVVRETLEEYLQGEPYFIGDKVRLRFRVLEDDRGIYGSTCTVCNTRTCDDVSFLLLDADGCEAPSFWNILNGGVPSTAVGTFMIGHLPGFSAYRGMAFSREFILFQFYDTQEVYFRCNLGYCLTEDDPFCTEHCVTQTGRRRRSADTSTGDWLITVITVQGELPEHTIGRQAQNTGSPGSCLEIRSVFWGWLFLVVLLWQLS